MPRRFLKVAVNRSESELNTRRALLSVDLQLAAGAARQSSWTVSPERTASTTGLDYLGYQDAPTRWHAGVGDQSNNGKDPAHLGASGDLTGRLLLPGLARLVARGHTPGLTLVGAGSDDWTPEQWLERLEASFADANSQANSAGKRELKRIRENTSYHRLDVTAEGQLAGLLATLAGPVAVYFALPPRISQLACEALTPEQVPAGTRLVMEKPFGSSEESARDLNRTLARPGPGGPHPSRVDHFLGKATVLNFLGLRFANTFLEPVWNRQHIEKVEIIFDEDLALEGRARYYDGAGALRDMIQSHLLQIMALMAIEPPPRWTSGTSGTPLPRCCVPAALRPRMPRTRAGRGTPPAPSTAARSPTTPRKRAWTRPGTPRPSPRCRWTSRTGAGRACRSSSARARRWAPCARRPW